nr:hypothetical protein BaRGS_011463 [Batillaria attramentaria]
MFNMAIIQVNTKWLDLTIHKKDQTPDAIYLHGLQQILADFPGFRRIFTDGSKSEDGRVGAAAVMDGRVFTRRLANDSLKVLFRDVPPDSVFSFLKEVNLFYKL